MVKPEHSQQRLRRYPSCQRRPPSVQFCPAPPQAEVQSPPKWEHLFTDRGICWNTDVAPTISNSKISCGSGLGSFTGNLTGLLGSTKYYVRAYATNSAGTGYGPQLVFTTAAPVLSTVTTNAVTSIAKTTATSGGNVTNSGGLAITERGVCFSATNTTPTTTAGTKLATGTGTGTFTSNLTGLTANTTYYLRAYSISDIGISYGSVVTFKTLP